MKYLGALLLITAAATVQAGDPFNGHRIYGDYCLQCHGDDGRGVLAGIPNLRRGEGLLQPDHQLAEILKRGLGAMPAYQGLLDDKELADVITYIRTLQ